MLALGPEENSYLNNSYVREAAVYVNKIKHIAYALISVDRTQLESSGILTYNVSLNPSHMVWALEFIVFE